MKYSPLTRPLSLAFLLVCAPALTSLQAAGPKAFDPALYQEVREMRRQGLTYEVEVNPAMQYPAGRLNGLRPDMKQADYRAHEPGGYENFEVEELDASALPASYTGYFSPAKDQGQCGSCWAFASIGELEGAYLKKHGYPIGKVNADGSISPGSARLDLSEQQLLSCNPWGYSCEGGWYAFDMLMPAKAASGSGYYPGAVPDFTFRYVAAQGACSFSAPPNYTPISAWGYVGAGDGIPSVAAIKAAIYKYGSVIAGVYADRKFQAYRSGVFTGSDNYSPCDHAILLVGWDDAKGAWLLKNSWTSQWGINGFMWIKYGANSVGTSAGWAMN